LYLIILNVSPPSKKVQQLTTGLLIEKSIVYPTVKLNVPGGGSGN